MNSKQNEPKSIKSSVAAATSMTFGIMSPIVLCSCLPTIVTSLCAIVLGHIALVKIKNSNGELVGRGRAITGLAIGYPFLILSLVLAPTFFSRIENFQNLVSDARVNAGQGGSYSAMSAAEQKILFTNTVAANGNDADAVKMADSFSSSMSVARNLLIINSDGSAHEGKFLTYCENRGSRVCFLVFVPEYRVYQEDAKHALADAAWMAATQVASEYREEENLEVGVGLKGGLFYGAVMTGRVDGLTPDSKSKDRNRLERFFEDPVRINPSN